MLSRLAREFAAEIANHDWSDAPYRIDRAGHQREFDTKRAKTHDPLSDGETLFVRTNVMWVTAQVLCYADPNLDPVEFAQACGVDLKPGIIKAGLRGSAGSYARPGSYEYDDETPGTGITWTCQVCHKPIADGEGGVLADHSAIAEYEEQVAAWQAEHGDKLVVDFLELDRYPEAVAWQVVHTSCGPEDRTDQYWISVSTLRTPWALVDWTSHLMGKAWLESTNWDDLLRKAVQRAPRDEVGKSVGD